jgi:hypothetical protein
MTEDTTVLPSETRHRPRRNRLWLRRCAVTAVLVLFAAALASLGSPPWYSLAGLTAVGALTTLGARHLTRHRTIGRVEGLRCSAPTGLLGRVSTAEVFRQRP